MNRLAGSNPAPSATSSLTPFRSITYWILRSFPSDRCTQLVHRRSGRRAQTSPPSEARLPLRKASVEADAVFETHRVRTAPDASVWLPASETDLERLVL